MIQYAEKSLIPSFYAALSQVAAEQVYIEMLTPPPLVRVMDFQCELIAQAAPTFFALDGTKVVGWCDISPIDNPRQKHRGQLGMGLLAEYRGRGLGKLLIHAALSKAQAFGLEKVELAVYTSNEPAVRLYERSGFVREGLIKNYRKLDKRYFDTLLMGKFLKP
jgi:RimJ/RimL family protein N-acetyltransferase